MRDKILLHQRPVPVAVNLYNGTSFASRYKRISRKQLPGNIRVARTRTIGPKKTPKTKKKSKVQVGQHTDTGQGKKNQKKIYKSKQKAKWKRAS